MGITKTTQKCQDRFGFHQLTSQICGRFVCTVLRGMGYMMLQQHEATGHAASTVRKQRKVNIDAQVTSSILLYLEPHIMA